jgi:hypothetical protein
MQWLGQRGKKVGWRGELGRSGRKGEVREVCGLFFQNLSSFETLFKNFKSF